MTHDSEHQTEANRVKALVNRALSHVDRCEFPLAETTMREALLIQPDDQLALRMMSMTLVLEGRYHDAEGFLLHALAIDRDNADALSQLGTVFRALGRLDESELAARRVLELRDPLLDDYLGLAAVLFEQKNYATAELYYRRAVELDKTAANAYRGLGDALRSQHKFDEMQDAYLKALQLDSHDSWSLQRLGGWLAEQGHYEAAEKVLASAIDTNPLDGMAHSTLAYVRILQDRAAEAEPSARTGLALDDTRAYSWFVLGGTLLYLERWREAMPYLERAVELDPQNVDSAKYLDLATRMAAQKGP